MELPGAWLSYPGTFPSRQTNQTASWPAPQNLCHS